MESITSTITGHIALSSICSRIIITIRDKQLLTAHDVNLIHEVKILHDPEALELLSWYAFKRSEPPLGDYVKLAERAMRYAQGLPLAFKFLGSHLYGGSIHKWQAALDGFQGTEIQEVLKISYNALDDRVKKVFLDITCFFKGTSGNYVTEACELNTRYCIDVLIEKALISVEGSYIQMHDLLEKMDVEHVLTNNTGTNKITGIVLNLPKQDDEIFLDVGTSFSKMKNLKILINYNESPKFLFEKGFSIETCFYLRPPSVIVRSRLLYLTARHRSMSDSESAYDSEPNAFDGESSNDQRDSNSMALSFESAANEEAEVEVVREKIRAPPYFSRGKVLQPNQAVPLAVAPCGDACASTSQYCEFLIRDTRLPDRHASYHSKTSTSSRGNVPAESSSDLAVTVVLQGNPRVPLGYPKRHLFSVDYLGLNLIIEAELAKYHADYLIPDSVKWMIPGPTKSLSNPKDGEVVFFTDVLKQGIRLPLQPAFQRILAHLATPPANTTPISGVTKSKSADHGGWVQANCLRASERGHFVSAVPSLQKSWRNRSVLMSDDCDSGKATIGGVREVSPFGAKTKKQQ
ncbi:hypothetical protein L3X38_002790 [Prunus dulcis]|uniref:Disease resistance protein Roq1-like winged-helix domain-containing protein n=1 Tax=Prunus dulcis TaxID=3755 RepID=A0AAD4ZL30_PRUDU|nr:hypothetical protein L3X38_002790 [Prunus dulcis]